MKKFLFILLCIVCPPVLAYLMIRSLVYTDCWTKGHRFWAITWSIVFAPFIILFLGMVYFGYFCNKSGWKEKAGW